MDEIESNAFNLKMKKKIEKKSNNNKKNIIYSNYNKKLHSNSNSFFNNKKPSKRNKNNFSMNLNDKSNTQKLLSSTNEDFQEILKENNSLINSLKTQNKQKKKRFKKSF